ncbi:MAG: hypothetical protein QG557_683 [Pseudomonadota bacterium]|nr:hypothetical protein [Pseudomonadota bacterium]
MIVNFSHSKAEAFKIGFMKGFTSPATLFRRHDMPELHQVRSIEIKTLTDEESLNNDWRAMWSDLSKAMVHHETSLK